MTGTFRFADHLVSIDSIYSDVQDYCAEYKEIGEPECSIKITNDDLILEEIKYKQRAKREGTEVRTVSKPFLEKLAVYRKIAEYMPSQDVILFHGSAISVDNECYLFTAPSGTGKSTHTKLWRELLGDRAIMVNDDKPLIHIDKNGNAIVYGTPWNGKHYLGNNIAVPLKAICLLQRSAENRISEITKKDAMTMLMEQTYRPASIDAMINTIQMLDRLTTSFYRMGCNMNISAARLSYTTMKS